jgi:hypothetical protein
MNPLKRILLSGLLLFVSTKASFGQGRDTAFAVQKLFRQRRLSAASSKDLASSMASASTLKEAIAGSIIGATPYFIGLSQAERFSVEREAQILSSYAEGKPIPADVRRKLRRRHFHRTAQDVAIAP